MVSSEKEEKPKIRKKRLILNQMFAYLTIVYIFLILLIVSKYFFGNLLIPLLALIFLWGIGRKLVQIEILVKEIRISAVVSEKSEWKNKMLSWSFFMKVFSWTAAIFIAISFFIFFNSIDEIYIGIIFIDAIFVYWINKKIKFPFIKHLKERSSVLIREFFTNFVNVFFLFVIYIIYSIFIENSISGFSPGTIDPAIPLWIKDNIHHSCDIFEKLIRINLLFVLTIQNAISLESWISVAYKIFHLLTMSFWPFLGITLFYRYCLAQCVIKFEDHNNEN